MNNLLAALLDRVDGQRKDRANWRCHVRLMKREGDWTGEEIASGIAPAPYETLEYDGNLLMTVGANQLWKALRGDGALTAFSNANAHIGVGDSSTAAAANQTDLQAAGNKLRKAMDVGFPKIGAGEDAELTDNQIRFQATFGDAEARFAWNEWAVFNANAAGTMLNRKVEANGTKGPGTWTLEVTITLQ